MVTLYLFPSSTANEHSRGPGMHSLTVLLKLSNVAKGRHRNSTKTLEDAMLPGYTNTELGYVGIFKWIQM